MAFTALTEYIKDDVREYARGKLWYWYIPLALFGMYAFYAILKFHPNTQPSLAILPASALNFGLHEIAHVATSMLPELLTAAAGSGSELLLGLLLIFGAFKTRCYFAVMFCCLWFMLACQSVGIYMADARAQDIDLVSLGGALSGTDAVIHDWNFIFDKLGVLGADKLIGGTMRGIGIAVGLMGLVFAAWVMMQIAEHSTDAASTGKLKRTPIPVDNSASAPTDPQHVGTARPAKAASIYPEATRGVGTAPPEVKKPDDTSRV